MWAFVKISDSAISRRFAIIRTRAVETRSQRTPSFLVTDDCEAQGIQVFQRWWHPWLGGGSLALLALAFAKATGSMKISLRFRKATPSVFIAFCPGTYRVRPPCPWTLRVYLFLRDVRSIFRVIYPYMGYLSVIMGYLSLII